MKNIKKVSLVIVSVVLIFTFCSQTFAASSPYIYRYKIDNTHFFQVRGVDKPHSLQNFSSWPGYASFVHSNCYHAHGEYKVTNSAGREISSKSKSIPLYCKGATRHIGQAFRYAAGELGLTTFKFLKVGGVLFTLIMNIPSVGGGGQTVCDNNSATNSTACYWVEY